MHIRPRGLRYRYPAHAGSWAARTLARFGGMLVFTLLLLSGLAPGAASARTHRSSADPSPQVAPPVPSPITPAPDLTPRAAAKLRASYSALASSQPAPSPVVPRSVPTVVSPRVVHTTAPSQSSSRTARVTTVPRHRVSTTGATPHRPARVSHTSPRPRFVPPAHATEAQRISLSFPLSSLTSELFRLPRAALHAGDAGHRDGLLLLLGSLAMGVVAVSSFALLRRLKRLEEQT